MRDHDDQVATWMGGALGLTMVRPYAAFGFLDADMRLKAGVLYNGYNGFNCDLTVYGPYGFTPEAVKFMFVYPFNDLGARRLSAYTKRSNRLARNLLVRLGFDYEACMRGYFGVSRRDDAMVYGMQREKCRWLNG